MRRRQKSQIKIKPGDYVKASVPRGKSVVTGLFRVASTFQEKDGSDRYCLTPVETPCPCSHNSIVTKHGIIAKARAPKPKKASTQRFSFKKMLLISIFGVVVGMPGAYWIVPAFKTWVDNIIVSLSKIQVDIHIKEE